MSSGGGVAVSGNMQCPAHETNPATMPASTEPVTNLPAATQAATDAPKPQPGVGHRTECVEPATGAAVPQNLSVQDAILTGLGKTKRQPPHPKATSMSPSPAPPKSRPVPAFDPTVTGSVAGRAEHRNRIR